MNPTPKNLRVIPVGKACSGFSVGFAFINHRDSQYIAYYDEKHRLTVASRRLDSSLWTFARPEGRWIPNRGRPGHIADFDSHNYLNMAFDSEGYLHLAGNMHGDPLVYFRSAKPGDITSLVAVEKMTGVDEDAVTYPIFFQGRGNDFLFRYRDGGSGNGADLYNRYDPVKKSWSRLLEKPLLDGEGGSNAYARLPEVGPDGFWHMIWMWRESPDCSTNKNLSYARSRDLIHWQTAAGTALELPITEKKGGVVDPAAPGEGLINMSQELGSDSTLRPVITYHRYDARGKSQAYAARWENGHWKIRELSQWNFRWDFKGGGSISGDVKISGAKPEGKGRLEVSYMTREAGDGVWILDEETLQVMETRALPPPLLPAEWMKPRQGLNPNMVVQTATCEAANTQYVLRWETLPINRDAPVEKEPAPSELEVIEVSP